MGYVGDTFWLANKGFPDNDCPCVIIVKISGAIPKPVFGSHPTRSSNADPSCADGGIV